MSEEQPPPEAPPGPADEAAAAAAAERMLAIQRGLRRLGYKRALSGLITATQQWAAAAQQVVVAAQAADPEGTFSDEETDAAEVIIQEIFRGAVKDAPAFRSLFAVVAGIFDASVPG